MVTVLVNGLGLSTAIPVFSSRTRCPVPEFSNKNELASKSQVEKSGQTRDWQFEENEPPAQLSVP
jgi:hypothetical protein